jgi:type II secretion system protein G
MNHQTINFRANPMRTLPTSRQQGFTLIEIMVVVVIIGILGALIVPNLIGRADEARVTAAKTDLRAIANALDLYRLDNFTYPTTEQGLEALVKKPSGQPEAPNWNPDGYLKKLPKDPWGREYLYISPGTQGAFDLYSLGADGREGGQGTAADILNWEE